MKATSPLIDANLLIWAHHGQFPRHPQAKIWWRELLSSSESVALPWATVLAFIRISSHPRILDRPPAMGELWRTSEEWLERTNVWVPRPTDRHRAILGELLKGANLRSNDVPDAHLAALSIEWGLELLTADRGFDRYRGLRWRNPLGD